MYKEAVGYEYLETKTSVITVINVQLVEEFHFISFSQVVYSMMTENHDNALTYIAVSEKQLNQVLFLLCSETRSL